MANEITVQGSLSFVKAPVNNQFVIPSFTLNMTGVNYVRATRSVPFAAAEAIPLGSIGTPGWFLVKNNDATNYIDIMDSAAGAHAVVRLLPGEVAIGRFSGAAPAWKANVAAVEVDYLVIES